MDGQNKETRHNVWEPAKTAERRPGRRWLLLGLAFVAAMLLLLLLAPTILTRPTVRDYLLAKFVPTEIGSVTLRRIHAGWFSTLALDGLKVIDWHGQPLLEVDRVEVNRSLLQLATRPTDLGKVVITEPTLHVALRPDGSNLEDLLARLAPQEASPTPEVPGEPLTVNMVFEAVRGTILAHESATGSQWQLEFDVEAEVPADLAQSWKAQLRGTFDGQPFLLVANSPMGQATESWPMGPQGSMQVEATDFSLQPLAYVAQRTGQPIEKIVGSLSIDGLVEWKPGANTTSRFPELDAHADLKLNGLQVEAAALFGPDVLRVEATRLKAQGSMAQDNAVVEHCELHSDFGRASLSTTVSVSDLMNGDTHAEIVPWLRRQQLATEGLLDVAAIATALPHAMHLREDVQLQSGRVTWDIASEQRGPVRWSGHIQTEDVAVLKTGQPMTWDLPLKVDFELTDGNELVLEQLTAQADQLFWLSCEGRLQQGKAQGQVDLRGLMEKLSEVVDLGGTQVTGGMQLAATWDQPNQDQIDFRAQSRLTNFQLAQQGSILLREEQLTTGIAASATAHDGSIVSLDAAQMQITSAGDLAFVQLKSPVQQPSASSVWPVVCRLQGELTDWMSRARTLGTEIPWEVVGQIDATSEIDLSAASTIVKTFDASINGLSAKSEAIHVQEPQLRISASGEIDNETFECHCPDAQIVSHSFAIAARDVQLAIQPDFGLSGRLDYRADVGRVMDYVQATTPQPRLSGEMTGHAQLAADKATTTFNMISDVANLRVDPAILNAAAVAESPVDSVPLWSEPKLSLKLEGTYDAGEDTMELRQAVVSGKVLQLQAVGHATRLASQPRANVQGQWAYDLEGLTAILAGVLGPEIRLSGQHQEQFALNGPLLPKTASPAQRVAEELTAEAGFGWSGVDAYGVLVGAGRADARLTGGVLQLSTIDAPVSTGRIRCTPTLHVNTEPMWITLAPEVVADNIALSPEMTGSWMKYVAPLLADATSAEGAFSVSLARTEIPLMQPMDGRVEGELELHGGSLGPGPLAQQFLSIASQIKQIIGKGNARIANPERAWMELRPQRIAFQLAEQRVYHEGLEIVIDDVPIRTSGSVGLDQTLSMVAEVPIQDEWVDSEPALSGLRGQTVSVAVGGTVSQPRLDQRALRQLSGQLIQQAARGYLQKELGNQVEQQLKKLFR